jgi:predicted ATPase/class 3 adenylate cyclase
MGPEGAQPAQRERLVAAIAALEAQRSALGDAVVDALLAPARAELAALQARAAKPAEPEQTLKQVSILFLDVVNSTALGQQLDPEDIGAVMDGALARATAIVQSHGGRVLQYAGDNLLAAFGADTAREDDAERAVLCGLALCELGRTMGEVVQRVHRRDGVHVRVGIHTGDVMLGGGVNDEGTIRGSSVNIAARMEQTAPPGALRISHDTHALVRGRFEVLAQEPLQVKGIDAPIRSVLVQRARARVSAAERRGVDGVATRMIGRDAEFESLCETYSRVSDTGTLALVSVVADAGLGKSRLLAEFTRWLGARPERATLLSGAALPQTQQQAYGLLRDIVTAHLQITEDDTPDAARAAIERGFAKVFAGSDASAVEAQAHLVGHLIGFDWQHSRHVQGVVHDPQQIRSRAFYALAQLLRRLAQSGGAPLVLILEDLHWADDPSLDFVSNLVDVDRDVPLLIVSAARPELAQRRPEWADGRPPRQRFELQPLDKRASRDLVHELLQRLPEVPAALRELLTGGAEGNPFYMEELVRMLIDQGAVFVGSGAGETWRLDADRLLATRVPPTLTGVLQARLDDLSPQQKRCLQQASIVGPVFSDRTLYAFDGAVHVELPALEQRGLLVAQAPTSPADARSYAFKHALLHQVVYGTVLKRARREWHGRLARWYTAQVEQGSLRDDEVLPLTAQHHELAGEALEAALCHASAAEHAAARFAHGAVIDHVARALPLLDSLSDRAELEQELLRCRWRLLSQRGLTLERTGRVAEHRTDLEAMHELAERSSEAVWHAVVASRRASVALRLADWSAAASHARRAMQCADDARDATMRLDNQATLALALRGQRQLESALTLGEQGLAESRALRVQRAEYRFLRVLALVYESLGDEVRSGEMEIEALQVARAAGDRAGQALGLVCEGLIAFFFGDAAQAQRSFEQGLELQRELGLRAGAAHTMTHLAAVVLVRGDAFQALGIARQALATALAVEARATELDARMLLGEADLTLGHATEAETAFAAALASAQAMGSGRQWAAHAGLARAALAAGHAERAFDRIQPILSHTWADERLDTYWEPEVVALACHDVLRTAGDERAAEWLTRAYDWMMAVANTIPDVARRQSHLQLTEPRRRIAQACRSAPG